MGSLQYFVPSVGVAEDFSPTLFSTLEVQRLAVLDIRLFNTDRHAANILVVRASPAMGPVAEGLEMPPPPPPGGGVGGGGGELLLVPIDHGFCLPAASAVVRGDALPSFEWRHWPQARAPLEPATLEYISRIDVFADAETLRGGGSAADANRCGGGGLGLREDCVRTMVISTMLLKAAAAAGLTLADVADIMCGPPDTGSFKRAAPAPDVAAAAAAAAASSGSGSTDRRTPFSVSPAASVDSRGRADSRGAELRSMFDAASTMLDGDETTLESPVDVINMQVDGVPEPASAATYAALRRLGAPPAAAGADDDEDDDMMGEAMPWPMGEGGAGGAAGVGGDGAAEGGGPTPLQRMCVEADAEARATQGGMLIIDAGIVDGRRESRYEGAFFDALGRRLAAAAAHAAAARAGA